MSTSRPRSIRKLTVLSTAGLRQDGAEAFMNEETTWEEILTNKEKAMLILFGSDQETLD